MVTTAFINIWGERVGAIAWDPTNEIGAFEYEPGFLSNNWDLAPVQMPQQEARGRVFSFPELRTTSTFKGLPGLLADILPDKYGNALINTWLTRQGRPTNSLNPVETLCFIGSRGMGALEVEPAFPKADDKATEIEIESLIQVAEQILSGRKDFAANVASDEEKALIDILKIGSSAGGARAKALITYNKSTGDIKSGQTNAPKGFTHWIIKFDGVTDTQFGSSSGYGRVEMAYYLMAKEAGITMTDSKLLEENGRAHFMTKRFDRVPDQGKVHVQSFCAMRHFDFNEVTMYSYEQLFETMRFLGLPYPQAEQLYRRMVFNVMGRNCDDHTKNFAFMMDKTGQWALSPAFDVCHAYRPDSDWVSQHALSINGKRTAITKNDLLAVANQMNVKKAASIIQEIAEVVSHWGKYAEQVGVEKVLQAGIGKTLQIIR
ncbi:MULTISPECIES: type II toxin-antitoxin system HipA family toxin [unclassified Imperialibacter]|uniref:type II toxin-antitoxin system HipA family toxin n=1 Tax=unclassified Imperialibacter TaxID=2629706 RepID=UPI0012544607|nr:MULTISPECIES: type II toxin-antitoxin system HipA family toxin [unclassified Imperialibacter]CAD5281482.1 Toxin HipA [Imperialibacter sp. 89]CAD5288097.1 Toxin HipA [Imperialibacter sp. 75]VVT31205.1 Toxin HipA [Imperialibacter sp. EC-SDR9]